MKKRKIKRLTLSRETLHHLNGKELEVVQGGATVVGCTKQRCSVISYCYHCITADATDCPSCGGGC